MPWSHPYGFSRILERGEKTRWSFQACLWPKKGRKNLTLRLPLPKQLAVQRQVDLCRHSTLGEQPSRRLSIAQSSNYFSFTCQLPASLGWPGLKWWWCQGRRRERERKKKEISVSHSLPVCRGNWLASPLKGKMVGLSNSSKTPSQDYVSWSV